jgi:hypothetical protein
VSGLTAAALAGGYSADTFPDALMEIFLLLLDELDDLAALVRAWLPRLIELLLALVLFSLTVMLALSWPVILTVSVAGVACGFATALHHARHHWPRWLGQWSVALRRH